MALAGFGARRALSEAVDAASGGRLGEASSRLREYFAARYVSQWMPLRGADARAAMLAATCAALRGDTDELAGIAKMVEVAFAPDTVAARDWVSVLRAALDGNAEVVFADIEHASPAVENVVPVIALLAAERAKGDISPRAAASLDRMFQGKETTPEIRARLAIVLAMAAQRRGDSEGVSRALKAMPSDAPMLYRFLASVAAGDLPAARGLAGRLDESDHGAATSFVASMAVSRSSAEVRELSELVRKFAHREGTAALRCALALALGREGDGAEAIRLLDAELKQDPGSELVNTAFAIVCVSVGDARRTVDLLTRDQDRGVRGSPPPMTGVAPGLPGSGDRGVRGSPPPMTGVAPGLPGSGARSARKTALLLVALAEAGDGEGLAREVLAADDLPHDVAAQVSATVLAGLVATRAIRPGLQLPGWLAAEPTDPRGKYMWAAMQLQQGATGNALRAFEQAIDADPSLAQDLDLHDAARVISAREALARGDMDTADRLGRSVTTPAFVREAARVRAFALLKRETGGAALDVHTFVSHIDSLRSRVSGDDHELIEVLESESARVRARELLRTEQTAAARALLQADTRDDADRGFLLAVADLMDGAPAEQLQATLQEVVRRDSTHEGANVLLAEIQAAVHGAEHKLDHLEEVHANLGPGSLIAEALAGAYGGVSRGLDAKRIGLEQYMRLRDDLPDSVASDITNALSFEAPPHGGASLKHSTLTRSAAFSLLPAATVADRSGLLVVRVTDATGRNPGLRATLEPLVKKLKSSVVVQDLETARTAELDILNVLSGVA